MWSEVACEGIVGILEGRYIWMRYQHRWCNNGIVGVWMNLVCLCDVSFIGWGNGRA